MHYAVLWSAGCGPIHAGRLALRSSSLVLEGSLAGESVRTEIGLAEISEVGICRRASQRLRGRPVLVIDQTGGEQLRVATLGGLGLLSELAERIVGARPKPA